ncbi:hypothetical protein ACH4PU_35830 [Streptomyces sp. NPDC021100]|uniref:hypothetical protein n=1 Tax=Streptomyces sp. NPDC021100 TaxID=3365114 RepID=UPI0037A3018B
MARSTKREVRRLERLPRHNDKRAPLMRRDAKDFTDDYLDRARDLEHDVRKAISNAVRPDKDDEETVATVTTRRGTVRQATTGTQSRTGSGAAH